MGGVVAGRFDYCCGWCWSAGAMVAVDAGRLEDGLVVG